MVEVMEEPQTALSVDGANVTELERRFGDRIRPGVIEVLYHINVEHLTEKAGGSFLIFVPDVAQRRTEEQLAPMYRAKGQSGETYVPQ